MATFPESVRIGTRGSRLALWQAEHVAARIRELGVAVEIEIVKTTGDLDRVSDFGSMGAKGIFTKEIEEALVEGRVDLAVHSLKDLPTELPSGLALAATLEREAPYDALVSRDGATFDALPEGARLATGSLRRAAQALALRPDLRVVPLRGNVPTRIRKIRDGEADATFLALAGVRRLGLEAETCEVFPASRVTPPMGQGAMAIETREADLAGALGELMRRFDHPATRLAVDAERAFIARIGGGCKTPAGVLVEPAGGSEIPGWTLTGMIASDDGKSLLRRVREIAGGNAASLVPVAEELADEMVGDADDAIRATLHRPV